MIIVTTKKGVKVMDYNEVELIRNFSHSVKKLMQENSLSINDFANRCGLTFAVVRNIKDGKVKKLNAKYVVRIAEYFRISPNDLLGIEELPPDICIKEEHVEFVTSFFEKEAGDFTYYNNCVFRKNYDSGYEECMVNAIHYFIESHKLATGYYHIGINMDKTKAITAKTVCEESTNHFLEHYFNDKATVKGNAENDMHGETEVDKVQATARAVKNMRELHSLSRKELAERTGLSVDCLYRIETADNKKVNFEHIQRISKVLLCTTDFLLGESCDPTANRDGASVFYQIHDEIEFRYVQLGHDLSYASNYMDEESKKILIGMIQNLDMMHTYMETNVANFGKRLSVQDVFFREQEIYKEKYKTRGAHFYTKRYSVTEGEN